MTGLAAFRGQRRQDLCTPRAFFEELAWRFGPFDLDVAASPESAKCAEFLTLADDGLEQPWCCDRAFCNPPYRDAAHWVQKACEEVKAGNCRRAVLLLPARTGSAWFRAALGSLLVTVHFVRGRVSFETPAGEKAGHGNFEDSVVLVVERPLTVGRSRSRDVVSIPGA